MHFWILDDLKKIRQLPRLVGSVCPKASTTCQQGCKRFFRDLFLNRPRPAHPTPLQLLFWAYKAAGNSNKALRFSNRKAFSTINSKGNS